MGNIKSWLIAISIGLATYYLATEILSKEQQSINPVEEHQEQSNEPQIPTTKNEHREKLHEIIEAAKLRHAKITSYRIKDDGSIGEMIVVYESALFKNTRGKHDANRLISQIKKYYSVSYISTETPSSLTYKITFRAK